MVNATSSLITATNNLSNIKKGMEFLNSQAVMVGIPREETKRKEADAEINNADLLYMHTHGIRRKSMRKEMQKRMEDGSKDYSDAYKLYVLEHGSPLWHSPPRPVLEPAIRHDKDKIAEQLGKTVSLAFRGEFDRAMAQFHKTGQTAERAARGWFRNPSNGWTENSEKTIAKKGSARPLIDTSQMEKSIIYVVRKRGET